MHGFWQDLRFGLRLLAKQPGFTFVALIALGLGIGANSAIFSIVNSVILQPLPYSEPGRLMTIWEDHQALGGPAAEFTSPTGFEDWRDQTRSFSDVAAYSGWAPTVSVRNSPEQIVGALVSHNMFSLLDVKPQIGRVFRREEDRRGGENVAVISHALWQRAFQGDPQAVGRPVTISGESYTLIGVMSPGFKFPVIADAEIWRTIQPALGEGCRRGCLILRVLARLKPEVTIEAARGELTALAKRLEKEFPESNSKIGFTVIPLHDFLVGDVRTPMLVMFGAVVLVLLIGCANVANLMLARSATRRREMAIRTALGAGRRRIIRQLLIESLTLSLLGGLIGFLISIWLVDLLVALSPQGLPRVGDIRVDWSVFVFAAATAILSGLIAGLAPVFQVSRLDLNDSLKDGVGMKSPGGGRFALNFLVAAEIAISLVLLIGAGLLLKSFINLKSVDPGFNPQGVLTMNVLFNSAGYPERSDVRSVTSRVLESISNIPGVTASGAVSSLPLGGSNTDTSFIIEGRPAPPPNQEPVAWYSSVSPDYFKAMGMRIVRGRMLSDSDLENTTPVVVINEKMAGRYFPGENPIGKRIGDGRPDGWRTIVGIAADVRHFGIDQESRPSMFMPLTQMPSRRLFLTVRSSADGTVAAIRRNLAGIDPNLAPANIATMEDLTSQSISLQRFTLLLIGVFAALAVILAAAGIYGVMSYAVAQRTREIGIRMALGAQSAGIFRLIIGQGMAVALIGVAFGLISAYGLTRLMAGLLYEVSEIDPLTFGAVSLLMLIVAVVACFVPARRAAILDPLKTLRYE